MDLADEMVSVDDMGTLWKEGFSHAFKGAAHIADKDFDATSFRSIDGREISSQILAVTRRKNVDDWMGLPIS